MRKNSVYLRHILDSIAQIEVYVGDMRFDIFMKTRLVQDGVIRQFEIIGEATKNLSEDFRGSHPDLPWKDMAGMRDKLIHQYFGVDMLAVWDSVEKDLPPLKEKLIAILRDIGD